MLLYLAGFEQHGDDRLDWSTRLLFTTNTRSLFSGSYPGERGGLDPWDSSGISRSIGVRRELGYREGEATVVGMDKIVF